MEFVIKLIIQTVENLIGYFQNIIKQFILLLIIYEELSEYIKA